MERCGEMNDCESVAAAMINGVSQHMAVNGSGRGRMEEAEGAWL